MSTEEEITARIGVLGEQIKVAKAEKKAKEVWEGALNEMLALKVRRAKQTTLCLCKGELFFLKKHFSFFFVRLNLRR